MKTSIVKLFGLALVATLSLGVAGCGSSDAEKIVDELSGVINDEETHPGSGSIGDLTSYSIVFIERNLNEEAINDIAEIYTYSKDFAYELISSDTTCPSLGYDTLIDAYEDEDFSVKEYMTQDYLSYCSDTSYQSSYYQSGTQSVLFYYNY